ncbi:MAG: hypothetical protein M1377_07540 [Deltaproteobacteria bacterium]|nr:hypothetical protein [Deltaproteobacteria bacterium]
MTVVVLQADHAAGRIATCACCGVRFRERSVRLCLSDPSGISGVICPECILQGPRGAARRMRVLLARRLACSPVLAGSPEQRDLETWQRWMSRKVEALESAGSFPMSARLAAVREMRETR